MSTDPPVVSVVVTTHYRNECLPDAIDSVLDQTYEPLECLVVDDSGTEHAREVVERYDGVSYVPHDDNRGQIAAWETGLDRTDGSYVQFLDDDDTLHERKIRSQVDVLDEREGAGVCYCGFVWVDDGAVVLPRYRGDVLEHALRFELSPSHTSSLLVERALLAECFPITRHRAATDAHLQIELARRTRFDYVEEPYVRRRPSTQGERPLAWEARREIFYEYEPLYDDVVPEEKARILGKIWYNLGQRRLEHHGWSVGVMRCYLRAFRLDRRSRSLLMLVLSPLGSTGQAIGRGIAERFPTRTVRSFGTRSSTADSQNRQE